ncbi:MAG: hypothetical protein AAF581_04960 [Planctomycetota bacterium]
MQRLVPRDFLGKLILVATLAPAIATTLGYGLNEIVGPLSLAAWEVLAGCCVLLTATFVWHPKSDVLPPQPSPTLVARALGLLPYAVLLPGIYARLTNTNLLVSSHGRFHVGYVYQILNGQLPPENPIFAGAPAGFYWLYHVLLAMVCDLLQVTPYLAHGIVAVAALVIGLFWIGRLLLLLIDASVSPFLLALLALFALFGMNLFGSLAMLSRGTAFFWIDAESTLHSTAVLKELRTMKLDARLCSLFHKYLHYSGVPAGLLYFNFGLFVVVRALKRGVHPGDFSLLAVAIAGAIAFHTLTGFYMVVCVLSATAMTLVANQLRNERQISLASISGWLRHWLAHFRRSRVAAKLARSLLLLFTIAVTLSCMHYVYTTTTGGPSLLELNDGTFLKRDWRNIRGAIWAIAPFLAVGVYAGWRRWDPPVVFASLLALIGLGLALLLHIEVYNEYKFIYLSTIPALIIATPVVHNFIGVPHPGPRIALLRRISGWAALVLVCSNLLLVSLAYRATPDSEFLYGQGTHVSSDTILHRELYDWIRKNTAVETVVVAPPMHRNTNPALSLTERVLLVARDNQFSGLRPGYDERWQILCDLYLERSPVVRRRAAIESLAAYWHAGDQTADRPLVLLVPHDVSRAEAVVGLPIRRLTEGATADLYQLIRE